MGILYECTVKYEFVSSLALVTIIIAVYNAYLSWFNDNLSLKLLILTLILALLSVIVQKSVKSHNK